MKKQLTTEQTLAIKNAFSAEGQKAADAIIAAIDAMAAEENKDYDINDLADKIATVIASAKDVPAPVAEMINNKIELQMKTIKNVMGSEKISQEVKDAAADAILQCHSPKEVKDALAKVAVENGISTLTFADIVDYSLVDKFGDENPLFAKLHKSEVNKFFYVAETMADAAALAKEHTKGATKDIEALTATGKTMTPKMIFKRQQIDIEDMLRLQKAGRLQQLLKWVTEELRRVLTNTEVMAILIGDTVNPVGKRISSFETIKKVSSDIWTVVTNAVNAMPTLTEVRTTADALYNPNGYEVVAVMNATTRTALAGFVYASGGDTYYRGEDELAAQIGVDSIYKTNLLGDGEVILLIPEEYWVHNEGEVEVAYDVFENNTHNLQYERMDCGAIHGLLSTAYVKPA